MKFHQILFCLSCLLLSCNDGEKKDASKVSRKEDSLYVKAQLDSVSKVFGKDTKKAKQILDNVKLFAESKDLPSVKPYITLKFGRYFYNTGDYDSALIYYNKTMTEAAAQKNYTLQAAAYGNMGNLHYSRGEYLKAMEVYLQDLKLLEANNDKESIGAVTGNLGLVYSELGNYKKAMEYQLLSLEQRKAIKDSVGMAQTYGNIGTLFYAEGDKLKCLEYMRRSYDMHRALNNKLGMGITLGNIGEIYHELGRYDSAQFYMEKGLEMKFAVQDNIGIVSSYMNLGELKTEAGKTEEGKADMLKALEQGQKLGAKPELLRIYKKLSKVYESEKNYEEAFKAFSKHIDIKDSLFNSEKIAEVNKKEMEYEFDKKEAINKAELEKQKLFRNAAVGGVAFLIVIAFVVFRNFQIKKKANVELNRQKEIIEEKQKEILDSIQYAEQIQKTLIANHDFVNETIPDSFVMFRPKDIVSGDFYWATKRDGKFYLAVCDSTGHGVPGAFMSLLNISFLNEAINEKFISDPASVFEHVRKRLIESISQNGRKDGMDGILICFDENSKTISYCAANNSPVLVSGNELRSLPNDKMPVGKGEKTSAFTTHIVPAKKGDMIYLFTDGYPDQFGGDKGKKFKYKPLQELFVNISQKNVQEQKEIIDSTFLKWKGNLEQIDDVCVVGVRVH